MLPTNQTAKFAQNPCAEFEEIAEIYESDPNGKHGGSGNQRTSRLFLETGNS